MKFWSNPQFTSLSSLGRDPWRREAGNLLPQSCLQCDAPARGLRAAGILQSSCGKWSLCPSSAHSVGLSMQAMHRAALARTRGVRPARSPG